MIKTVKKENIQAISNFLSIFDRLFIPSAFSRILNIKEEDNENCLCSIVYEEDYQRATINIFPDFFKESMEEQRKTLLHELSHIITLPSKEKAFKLLNGKLVTPEELRHENERATSKIENIMDYILTDLDLYHAYNNYGKKIKTKNKRHTKKNLGRVQKNNKS